MIKTIGSSDNADEIDRLYKKGKEFINTYQGQQNLNFSDSDFNEIVTKSIKSINIEGVSLLLKKIYSDIGFEKIDSPLLK